MFVKTPHTDWRSITGTNQAFITWFAHSAYPNCSNPHTLYLSRKNQFRCVPGTNIVRAMLTSDHMGILRIHSATECCDVYEISDGLHRVVTPEGMVQRIKTSFLQLWFSSKLLPASPRIFWRRRHNVQIKTGYPNRASPDDHFLVDSLVHPWQCGRSNHQLKEVTMETTTATSAVWHGTIDNSGRVLIPVELRKKLSVLGEIV